MSATAFQMRRRQENEKSKIQVKTNQKKVNQKK